MRQIAAAVFILVVPLLIHADSTRTHQPSVRRLLVSVPGDGVYLYDLQGTELWSYRCNPYDAVELSGGRILVTDRQAGRIFIVSRDGQVDWEYDELEGPVNAEPLDNGSVLVVENDSGIVFEVARDKKKFKRATGHRTPFDARRRSNGNIVVADSGSNRIVEVDADRKIIRETLGLKFPNSVCLLPGGRTLFTTYTNGTIGELDESGRVVWERRLGGVLYSIVPEGSSYWVADGSESRVLQVTREGTLLRQIKLPKKFLDVAFCR